MIIDHSVLKGISVITSFLVANKTLIKLNTRNILIASVIKIMIQVLSFLKSILILLLRKESSLVVDLSEVNLIKCF